MSVAERNNINISGKGSQPMLFAHGFGCDQNMWRFVAPAFADDYRIILFDHVGFGGSDLTAYDRHKYDSLDGYARDVLEICRKLELTDVIYVGHSVSSMIGVLASIEAPEYFDKLVLISPSPNYINTDDYHGGFSRDDIEQLLDFMDSNYLGWSSTIAPTITGNPDRPELGEELTNRFCRNDPKIAKHFARVTFLSDNRADLPRVSCKTLVIQCAEDAIAPRPVGEFVHSQIPQSEFALLDTSGHCPNLSAPDATIAAMKSFLK